MGWFWKKDKLQLIAFQAYGTQCHFYARGRALEDEDIDLNKKNIFSLLVNSWKRFETDEIKNTPLVIALPDGRTLECKTDEDGYYLIDTHLEGLGNFVDEGGWLVYEIRYADGALKREIQNENCFKGALLIPSEKASFGVISDIDDTILHTGVASSLKWRVVFNTFFKSAGKRVPLEGAADFYHKLHKGVTGEAVNPIFYVSHSPWNLYRYLAFFLKNSNFPQGPILLRSFADIRKRKKGDLPQKQKEILNILKTYPKLSFILIGDSGEHDADIYMAIANQFPKQILAIYLRTVKHKKKMLRIRALVNNYKKTPILLVDTSACAIAHAKENGFISG